MSEGASSGDRWQSIEALFHLASDLPEGERSTFLDRRCADDIALRHEVESLLAADAVVENQLERAVEGVFSLAATEAGEAPLERLRIGPYRVLRELGRGGLSTVFLGQRDDEDFPLKVAIKVVKRGMDTRDILRRLRQERRILASLDHPNISRLMDGGSTEDGLPYFIMEYIEGQTIDAYCESRSLDIDQCLELFTQVCGAVHYAHQSLIVHRDIKPGNLMVTQDGIPKLLDFGIAKLMTPDSADTPAVAAATATAAAAMTAPASNGDWSEGVLNASGVSAVNASGTTQLRVYFVLDDNDNGSDDHMGYYSGDNGNAANHPQLVVTYQP